MLTGYLGCFRKTLIGVIAISHETKVFRLFLSFKSVKLKIGSIKAMNVEGRCWRLRPAVSSFREF